MNRAEKRREIKQGFRDKVREHFGCTWRALRRSYGIKGKIRLNTRLRIVNMLLGEEVKQ